VDVPEALEVSVVYDGVFNAGCSGFFMMKMVNFILENEI